MHIVYGLCDPFDGAIRYVGCSRVIKGRCYDHVRRAIRGYAGPTYDWIRGLLKRNADFQVVILEENVSDPKGREIYWVRRLRERGFPLTNRTDGGPGTLNWQMPNSERERRRKVAERRWADPANHEDQRQKALKHWADPVFKARMKASLKTANNTDEARQRHSAVANRLWKDPAFRQKMLNSRNLCFRKKPGDA